MQTDNDYLYPRLHPGGEILDWEEIYLANYTGLYQYAFTMLNNGSLAEEMIHQVFLRLLEKKESIAIHTSLKAYLYRSVNILGGEISMYKRVTNRLEASLTGGVNYYFRPFLHYYIQADGTNTSGLTIGHTTREAIPLKAGLRVYAVNRFYIGGEAGAALAAHGDISFVYSLCRQDYKSAMLPALG